VNPRIAGAVALFAAVLAVMLLWLLSPSSEPLAPPKKPAPVAVAPARAVPSPVPQALRAPMPEPLDEEAERPLAVPVAMPFRPPVMPRPPMDPDRVYDAELTGIASAMLDRQDRLVGCYRAHVDTHGAVHGRPTLRATVMPDDGVSERFEIQIENDGEGLGDLDACLQRSMSDATFGDVEIPSTVLYPLPLPANF
jgi:hypothetical protein